MSKLIALDYGTKKVGVAFCHLDFFLVFPRPTLVNDERLLSNLLELVRGENLEKIVIGLPLYTNNQESKQTKLVYEFADKLKTALLEANLAKCEVLFHDEKLTTFEAKNLVEDLKATDLNQDLDSLSAVLILRDYLGLPAANSI